MGTLVRLELYKLGRKKSFWISLFILFIYWIECYLAWTDPLGGNVHILAKDGAVLHGRAAVGQERETARQYQGILTDETVERIFRNEAYNETQIRELWDIYNSEKNISISASCASRLLGYYFLVMNTLPGQTDSLGYYYGEEELRKIGEVFPESALPLYYEYSVPWGGTLESILICIFAFNILVILGVSPVFSEERKQKMNQLLFTSRFGRRKCFWAKAAAAYVLSGVLALGVVASLMIVTFSFFGAEGLACSIQLVEPFLYQDYLLARTLGAVIADAVVLSVAGIGFTVSLTLFASVIAKNALNTVIISFALFAAPVILRIFPVADQIRLIAPVNRMTDFAKVLCIPCVKVGNVDIPYSYVIAGTLIIGSAVLTLCASGIYQKKSDE